MKILLHGFDREIQDRSLNVFLPDIKRTVNNLFTLIEQNVFKILKAFIQYQETGGGPSN